MGSLNSSGVATATSTNFHDIGATTITAHFNGNAIEAAVSGSQPLTINGDATTTTLILPKTSASVGTSVSIGASVFDTTLSHAVTYGNVTFYANSTPIGVAVLSSSSPSTTIQTSSLPVGSYTITARFNGNATEAVSTSTGQTLTIVSATLP